MLFRSMVIIALSLQNYLVWERHFCMCDKTHSSRIATSSVSRSVAHPMIMLLEQDQMVQSYRWHLTFAFGLLEPLLRLSILFRPHQEHTECLVTIQLLTLASQYAPGGGGRNRTAVHHDSPSCIVHKLVGHFSTVPKSRWCAFRSQAA